MRVTAVIPARYHSSRLPGKPLADIGGKTMVQHVYERASLAAMVDEALVATDDERVMNAVRAFGGKALLTSRACSTGTDRVLEAAAAHPADIYLNIQGDEPFLDPGAVDQLVKALLDGGPDPGVATLCRSITADEAANPNIVKVVRDSAGNALYFSRAPIPYGRDGEPVEFWGHMGIYAYGAKALRRFGQLPPSPLELAEKLEQLRLLQAGIAVRVVETQGFGPAVDTAGDLEEARRVISGQGGNGGQGEIAPDCAHRSAAHSGMLPQKSSSLQERLSSIRLIITDVDGVLTDGGLYYGPDGESLKRFHARDGLGIKMLQEAGVAVAVLSGRDCPALRARLRDLGIEIFRLGQARKQGACAEIMAEAGRAPAETLFVGDDVPDMRAFACCGLGAAVADAPPYVRAAADMVLKEAGGHGAFRELADALLAARGRKDLFEPAAAAAPCRPAEGGCLC